MAVRQAGPMAVFQAGPMAVRQAGPVPVKKYIISHYDPEKSLKELEEEAEKAKVKVGFVGSGSSVIGILLPKFLSTGYTFTVWKETFKEIMQNSRFHCFKYTSENVDVFSETEDELSAEGSIRGVFEDNLGIKWSFDIVQHPKEVIENSDFIFSFFDDPGVLKMVRSSKYGLLSAYYPSKGYIEMTSINAATSMATGKVIEKLGGKYLEVSFMPSIILLKEENVVLFSAGSKELMEKCFPCFKTITKRERIFYYGSKVGYAANMNLLTQFCMYSNVIALSEVLGLSEAIGIDQTLLLRLIKKDFELSPLVVRKSYAMLTKRYPLDTSVEFAQNSLTFLNDILHAMDSSGAIMRLTLQALMLAQKKGHGFDDVSAVHSNNLPIG